MSELYEHRPRELQALITAERAGVAFVHWRDGASELQILALETQRGRLTIGRRDRCGIPLTFDSEVSREHAFLEPIDDEWTLVDDGLSRNGSFVNGSRVRGRQRLHDKDAMVFGRTRVVFRAPGEGDSESTARESDSPNAIPFSGEQRRILIALCHPIVVSGAATPATNPQIAVEVHKSVDAVKAHLRELFRRFDLDELPQNEKRRRLVDIVLDSGQLQPHDF